MDKCPERADEDLRFQKNNHPKRITVVAARYAPCGDGHGDARLRILGQSKSWKFPNQRRFARSGDPGKRFAALPTLRNKT